MHVPPLQFDETNACAVEEFRKESAKCRVRPESRVQQQATTRRKCNPGAITGLSVLFAGAYSCVQTSWTPGSRTPFDMHDGACPLQHIQKTATPDALVCLVYARVLLIPVTVSDCVRPTTSAAHQPYVHQFPAPTTSHVQSRL